MLRTFLTWNADNREGFLFSCILNSSLWILWILWILWKKFCLRINMLILLINIVTILVKDTFGLLPPRQILLDQQLQHSKLLLHEILRTTNDETRMQLRVTIELAVIVGVGAIFISSLQFWDSPYPLYNFRIFFSHHFHISQCFNLLS